MPQPALELRSVTVRYRDDSGTHPNEVLALDRVSLAVEAGECVGIVGGSGAGKTTLLLCAAGILSHESGIVSALRPAFVARTRSEHPYLSLRTSLEESASRLEQAGWDGEADVGDALRRTALLPLGELRMGQLAAGARARACLAHALLGNPRLICVDDPFPGMSAVDWQCYAECLRKLCDGGTAILLGARSAEGLRGVVSRFVVLHAGRVVRAATTGRLLELEVALPGPAAAALSGRVPSVFQRGRALHVALERVSAEEVLSACVALGIRVHGSRVIGPAAPGRVAEGDP